MTEYGVFARVFPPGRPDDVAAQIRASGFTVTQLNLSALGRPTLDADLTDDDAADIAAAFGRHGVRIWGLSGTFNAIDPNIEARRVGIKGCRAVI